MLVLSIGRLIKTNKAPIENSKKRNGEIKKAPDLSNERNHWPAKREIAPKTITANAAPLNVKNVRAIKSINGNTR
jgi:hypothetical protein